MTSFSDRLNAAWIEGALNPPRLPEWVFHWFLLLSGILIGSLGHAS